MKTPSHLEREREGDKDRERRRDRASQKTLELPVLQESAFVGP